MEPGALDPGRPLRHVDTLQVTPRVAGTTLQSRVRSAWAVARRIDELLIGVSASGRGEFRPTAPDELSDLGDAPKPA
jgi:D-3-phosphoglycerate dehydrogenase